VQGRSITLTSEWSRGDGTPVDVDNLTITITPVAGGDPVAGPTATGVTHPATGVYGYTWETPADLPAGDYLALWEGTYAGQPVSASEVVTVLAAPVTGAYASVDDLTEHLGRTPANAAQLLVRASRDVDRALLCAVYDPEDPDVVAALRMATLEQVAANLDMGNLSGNGRTSGGGFTLGRLSVQPASQDSEGAPRRIGTLWEQAWSVLQAAGLTGHGPMVA